MFLPQIDPNAMDWIQALSWVAAIAVGLFGIVKIVIELKQSRLQRVRELRWKKAQAAKALNDEMLADKAADAAMFMLDWDGREFEIKAGERSSITRPEMLSALRTTNTVFSDKEMFVRDSFDKWLYYLGIFEHHISRDLIDFMDIEYPVEYYVGLMARDGAVFEEYLRRYGFGRTLSFLARFESWGRGPLTGPPVPPNTRLERITGKHRHSTSGR